MSSSLIERLVYELGYPAVDSEGFDDFVRSHEYTVLFFTENPDSFPESNDVAVILPELMKTFGDRVAPAVVSRDSERELFKRFKLTAWPALVFLRRGEYLGVITRVQDWDDYLDEIERILAAEPHQPPSHVPMGALGGC